MKSGFIREYSGIVSLGQRVLDVVIVVGARALMWRAYVGTWTLRDTTLALVSVIGYLLFAEANGVYRSWRGTGVRREIQVVLWTWLLTGPLVLLWLFATKTSEDYSRVATFGWFALAAVGLAASRSLKKGVLGLLRSQGRNSRTAGIIGANALTQRLLTELKDATHGIEVVGVYDSRGLGRVQEHLNGTPLAGSFEDAIQDARDGKIDIVYITLPLRAESRIAKAVAELADTTATVHLVTDFSAFDLLRARWGTTGGLPTVSLFDTPFSGASGWVKRMEDLVLGLVFLAAAMPLMLLIGLLIKVTTGGPVFFAQTRYGLNGRPIRVLKFRTMTCAQDGPDVPQATKGDSRVTPIGAFLRSSSLDELPQLVNVVKGDMSIVGPRPHAVAHNELYRSLIHGYMLRHKVKPGITGWAQINGFRGETDTVDKMRSRVQYDLEYIENWDLRWDLEIILKTVLFVWRQRNAH